MPWRCPACSTPIRAELIAAGDESPSPGRIYVCSVCHLELVLNDEGNQMTVAPMPGEKASQH